MQTGMATEERTAQRQFEVENNLEIIKDPDSAFVVSLFPGLSCVRLLGYERTCDAGG